MKIQENKKKCDKCKKRDAIIYQWEKWLCSSCWLTERTYQENKEKQYAEIRE
jgi:hypothetical protein